MDKYSKIMTRKIISSYGGVGSIIETTKGALIIENFDKWPFITADNELYKQQDYSIIDIRLLNRLRNKNAFPKLSGFFIIPSGIESYKNPDIPHNSKMAVSGKYFPEWFYCEKCNRFNKISNWWDSWKNVMHKYNRSNDTIRSTFFDEPKCSYCYDNARENGKKRWNYYLIQIRFIMTSPYGNIRDIPWDEWTSCTKKEDDPETGKKVEINLNGKCCTNQDLLYKKSNKFSDLSGISIICNNCKKRNTLSGLFGLNLPDDNKNESYYKPVIRTSNSVYYPIIVKSLFIPAKETISSEDRIRIKSFLSKNRPINFIYLALDEKYSVKQIKQYIEGENEGNFESEIEYRYKEYEYLLSKEKEMSDNLVFTKKTVDNLYDYGIQDIREIKRVKITSVQTSYTRQEPIENDIFLGNEIIDTRIKPKYTSKWGKNANYLPAIENFGEGIFISFNLEKMDEWTEKTMHNEKAKERINTIYYNLEENDYFPKDKFKHVKHLCKFILVHTFSHLLIKELEFKCGYPAASLSERLYVDNDRMVGTFIYTVAGLEGSYGGLIRYSGENRLLNLINSALFRAQDCASDPVCYNTIGGQGIGGLNMAACYSCALLPETSCEEFNCFLDRALLIDNQYGYLKDKIPK